MTTQDDGLFICRRITGIPRHEGETGYHYYEPIAPYVSVTDQARLDALDNIFGPTEKGDRPLNSQSLLELAGKIAQHADTIKAALQTPAPSEMVDLEDLRVGNTGIIVDSFGKARQEGWNTCLDYLVSTGRLTVKPTEETKI